MKEYCLGVDIGGTSIKIGLVKRNGELKECWQIPTDISNNGENILDDITKSITLKLKDFNIEKEEIIGIGMGVPGPVNKEGIVFKCVNLGWGVFNVSQELEKKIGLKVVVGNDANVAALGEMWQGGGKGYSDLVLFTLGTGVGGGVIVNGNIINGVTGAAGEIGHMTVVLENGNQCGCGKKGCLETVASATGIVKEANKALEKTNKKTTLEEYSYLSAKDIFNEAKNKDEVAMELVEQLGMYLGLATAHIANTINPEEIVIEDKYNFIKSLSFTANGEKQSAYVVMEWHENISEGTLNQLYEIVASIKVK